MDSVRGHNNSHILGCDLQASDLEAARFECILTISLPADNVSSDKVVIILTV